MNSQRAKSKKTLDLEKVKDIIFSDLDILFDSLGLEYRRDGDNIFMRCPIHEGSDNPNGLSFSIERRMWKCWTRGCHEHYNTDIFGFVAGCLDTDSFSDVLRFISSTYDLNGATGQWKKKETVDDESKIFKNLVKQFKKREKKTTTVKDVFIGPFPSQMLAGSPYFESRGFKKQTLKHFGVRDSDSLLMRNRSIIPVNYKNQAVGFIARATKDWLMPKYLFSDGFKKTEYLYNYDNAITSAQKLNCMFLVEGQGDVWKLYEAGVENAVGLFGKDISSSQRSLLLKTGVTKLVVLTDNDQAGRESKIKIKRDLSRLFNLVFPQMHTKDLGNMFVDKIKQDVLQNLKGCY
tara:strand:- start:340 stop:1383 length:1044 start_codon:yes stop_codon:yes gene_type:complete